MSPFHEACFYESLPKEEVLGTLCPQNRNSDGARGACSVLAMSREPTARG